MEEKQEITWGQVARKLFGFLCGMKCSLILLSVILAACTAGSVVPQNQPQAWYEAQYGGAARWIMMFSLDDVFGCTWFGLLSALLALNLVLCSIVRFPHLWKQWRTSFSAQNRLQRQDASFVMELESPVDLQALGFRRVETVTDASGTAVQYAVRSRFGVWGSWLCHLGMLLIMGGFALGGVLATEDTVYGIPGSKQPIGDTGY
ncbi:cytochrome c biogenesis protein ResB, partial [bacterium]|nr:cytochrome c biogenesis protein ResB [bacterium]